MAASVRRHRLQVVRPVSHVLGNEVRDDLRVRLRSEAVALLEELFLELQVVFDDAVMHHRDGVHHVGVGVGFGGAPVGGPAGVPDAHLSEKGLLAQQFFQLHELAQAPTDSQSAVADDRHARRVIAPVLQALQAVQDDGHGLLGAQISDDAAHSYLG